MRKPTPIDLTSHTVFLDDSAADLAAKQARGDYQEALAAGRARWSGADLRGKAGRYYGGNYKRSRDALVQRWRAAGLRVVFVRASFDRWVAVVATVDFAVAVRGPRSARAGEVLAAGKLTRMKDGHPVDIFPTSIPGARVYAARGPHFTAYAETAVAA